MNSACKRLALDVLDYVVRAGWTRDRRTFIDEAITAGADRREVARLLLYARSGQKREAEPGRAPSGARLAKILP